MARVRLASLEFRRCIRLLIPRRDLAKTPLCSPVTHALQRWLAVLRLECPCCSSAPFQSRSSASAPQFRPSAPPNSQPQVVPPLVAPALAAKSPSVLARTLSCPRATPPIPAPAPLQSSLQMFSAFPLLHHHETHNLEGRGLFTL